jgi:hypothetical protein
MTLIDQLVPTSYHLQMTLLSSLSAWINEQNIAHTNNCSIIQHTLVCFVYHRAMPQRPINFDSKKNGYDLPVHISGLDFTTEYYRVLCRSL